jgi:uncharacterized protein (DUF4415 family)
MNEKNGMSASRNDIDVEMAKMEDPRYWVRADHLAGQPDRESSLTNDDGIGVDWSQAQVKSGDPRSEYAEKQQLTVRYDKKVIEYFKGTGKGYQTRMNAVLRDYVERKLKRDAS